MSLVILEWFRCDDRNLFFLRENPKKTGTRQCLRFLRKTSCVLNFRTYFFASCENVSVKSCFSSNMESLTTLSYPPYCYWWLVMKKRGWKLYRSPNPNPRGVRKCNSALSSSISASFYIKISVIEAAHSLNLFLLYRHLFWVGNYLRLSKNEIKTLFWFCTYVMFSIL